MALYKYMVITVIVEYDEENHDEIAERKGCYRGNNLKTLVTRVKRGLTKQIKTFPESDNIDDLYQKRIAIEVEDNKNE